MGALKHHYITKRFRELLTGNSRFLTQNLLDQLLYYTVVIESCLYVTEIVETLGPNSLGRYDGLATVFSGLDRFLNQERDILKAVCMEFYFKRKIH